MYLVMLKKRNFMISLVMLHLKRDFHREAVSLITQTECIESIILREMHRIYLVTYLAICLMTVTLEAVEVLVVMAAFVKTEILEDMTDFQERISTFPICMCIFSLPILKKRIIP